MPRAWVPHLLSWRSCRAARLTVRLDGTPPEGAGVDEKMATLPATKLGAAIRDGDLTSTELLECYLDRIERLGSEVNAVVTLDVERARGAAAAADEAHTMGANLGPLHGLPITIK